MRKQSHSNSPATWKRRIGTNPATRTTFERVIKQEWKCDSRTAGLEFDRALSRGEVEAFGIVGSIMAYVCKT